MAETDKTVYTFYGVLLEGFQWVYHYRAEDETLAVAKVVSVQKCLRKTVPYPVDRAKFVVGRCEGGSEK